MRYGDGYTIKCYGGFLHKQSICYYHDESLEPITRELRRNGYMLASKRGKEYIALQHRRHLRTI